MRLSPASLIVALVACAAVAWPQAAQQAPERGGDNLVPIDVEVVDAAGRPAVGLTPDDFDLTIDGQPRRVASVQFVSFGIGGSSIPPPERLFALAIDLASFSPIESIGITVSAQGFVDRIPENDRVAVFTYPDGKATEPTADRDVLRRALEELAGRRPELATARTPAPLAAPKADPATDRSRSLSGLHDVLDRLRPISGRKVLVLVVPGRDAVGGVPEMRDLVALCQQTAQSGAIIYTLLVDTSVIDLTIPEKEQPLRPPNTTADETAFYRWLDTLSQASGGRLVQVSGVNPGPAFNRLLNEVSGYYVLQVDAAARDGRPHALSVKTRQTGVTVRARSFAVLPGSSPNAAASVAAPIVAAPAEAGRTAPASAPDRARSPSVTDPVLSAFERGQYAAAQQGIAQTPDMAKWIRDFRAAKSPWPDLPRRTSVFALEVVAVAFNVGDAPARDEAVKLLLQQAGTMRSGRALDNFECGWYWAGLMLFEGSDHPDLAGPFAARAIARCPDEPRITLANAVLLDVSSPVLAGGLRVGAAAEAEKASHGAVLAAYEAAMKFPETEAEARVREAWFLYRLKRYDDALKLLGGSAPGTAGSDASQGQVDQQVRYLWHLIQGHTFRALNRQDDAVAAFRKAIAEWPHTQAARVSLLTLFGTNGRTAEAAALAAEIESTPEDATDPWWWFWLGDRPIYPLLMARLRGAVQ